MNSKILVLIIIIGAFSKTYSQDSLVFPNPFILESANSLDEYLKNAVIFYNLPTSFNELNSNTQKLILENYDKTKVDEINKDLYKSNFHKEEFNLDIIRASNLISIKKLKIDSIKSNFSFNFYSLLNDIDNELQLIEGNNGFNEHANHAQPILKSLKENNSFIKLVIFIDILLAGSYQDQNFLIQLLFKASHTFNTSIKNISFIFNCETSTKDKIELKIKWEDDILVNGNKFLFNSVEKSYKIRENDSQKNKISKLNNSYSLYHQFLKESLIKNYGQNNIREIAAKPSMFQIVDVRNIVTYNDNYWERIELSVYSMKVENDVFTISGFIDGTYYGSISAKSPRNEIWNSSINFNSNSSYLKALFAFNYSLYDELWKRINENIDTGK